MHDSANGLIGLEQIRKRSIMSMLAAYEQSDCLSLHSAASFKGLKFVPYGLL
jgi:hypothetical protein